MQLNPEKGFLLIYPEKFVISTTKSEIEMFYAVELNTKRNFQVRASKNIRKLLLLNLKIFQIYMRFFY